MLIWSSVHKTDEDRYNDDFEANVKCSCSLSGRDQDLKNENPGGFRLYKIRLDFIQQTIMMMMMQMMKLTES